MKTEEDLKADIEKLETLPVEKISRRQFDALLEYSCSSPTGVIPGKVWKRDLRFGLHTSRSKPVWVLCEYVAAGPDHCRTEFLRPEIVE